MNTEYVSYTDPGHGWLAVPLADLRALGIDNAISGFSYVNGEVAYLEEDCDLSTFVYAWRLANNGAMPPIASRDIYNDYSSPVRRYNRYPEAADWRERAAAICAACNARFSEEPVT